MAYKKLISGRNIDVDEDIKIVIRFLTEKFGAEQHKRPCFENLVWLDKKIWWVIPSRDINSVDICYGQECDKCEIIRQLKELAAGILIFRQMADHRICIYLLDNIDKLERHCKSDLILNWDSIDSMKVFSELGIVIDKELIGFKRLRQLRHDSVYHSGETVA